MVKGFQYFTSPYKHCICVCLKKRMNVTNTTLTNTTTQHDQAVTGLLLFVFACLSLLVALLMAIFRPCKGGTSAVPSCGFCSICCQYMCLRFYKLFCCRCCKKGHKYVIQRAGNLQQQMETELEEWDTIANELSDDDNEYV